MLGGGRQRWVVDDDSDEAQQFSHKASGLAADVGWAEMCFQWVGDWAAEAQRVLLLERRRNGMDTFQRLDILGCDERRGEKSFESVCINDAQP